MTEPSTETEPSVLDYVLRRDRKVVKTVLVFVIAVSWIFLLMGAGTGMLPHEMATLVPEEMSTASQEDMSEMSGDDAMTEMGDQPSMGDMEMSKDAGSMDMAMTLVAWTPSYALLMFSMWWLMMIAMMLPSAAPMVLLHATVTRKGLPDTSPTRLRSASTAFVGGYLAMWGAFSLVAVVAQWALERGELLSAMMMPTSKWLGAALLLSAGVWQLTPFKTACLRHCRSPVQFLSDNFRPGVAGAFRMGVKHGAFCLGCCWFLMALLFFGGVMNLIWIIGLAVFVLAEKVMPAGVAFGRVTGVLLIAWGVWLGFMAF